GPVRGRRLARRWREPIPVTIRNIPATPRINVVGWLGAPAQSGDSAEQARLLCRWLRLRRIAAGRRLWCMSGIVPTGLCPVLPLRDGRKIVHRRHAPRCPLHRDGWRRRERLRRTTTLVAAALRKRRRDRIAA